MTKSLKFSEEFFSEGEKLGKRFKDNWNVDNFVGKISATVGQCKGHLFCFLPYFFTVTFRLKEEQNLVYYLDLLCETNTSSLHFVLSFSPRSSGSMEFE